MSDGAASMAAGCCMWAISVPLFIVAIIAVEKNKEATICMDVDLKETNACITEFAGSGANGAIYLSESDDGVTVTGEVQGLPASTSINVMVAQEKSCDEDSFNAYYDVSEHDSDPWADSNLSTNGDGEISTVVTTNPIDTGYTLNKMETRTVVLSNGDDVVGCGVINGECPQSNRRRLASTEVCKTLLATDLSTTEQCKDATRIDDLALFIHIWGILSIVSSTCTCMCTQLAGDNQEQNPGQICSCLPGTASFVIQAMLLDTWRTMDDDCRDLLKDNFNDTISLYVGLGIPVYLLIVGLCIIAYACLCVPCLIAMTGAMGER